MWVLKSESVRFRFECQIYNFCWSSQLISLNFTVFTFTISINNNTWLLTMLKSLGLHSLTLLLETNEKWQLHGKQTWFQKSNNGWHKTVIPEGGEIHEARLWYPGFLFTGGHYPEERIRKGNLYRTLMFHWVEETQRLSDWDCRAKYQRWWDYEKKVHKCVTRDW